MPQTVSADCILHVVTAEGWCLANCNLFSIPKWWFVKAVGADGCEKSTALTFEAGCTLGPRHRFGTAPCPAPLERRGVGAVRTVRHPVGVPAAVVALVPQFVGRVEGPRPPPTQPRVSGLQVEGVHVPEVILDLGETPHLPIERRARIEHENARGRVSSCV